ncbi:uncharacterized protein LOC133724342 [Rosa rugosa]|uniref:uncharacterized protein LOC133724342 n=1 Tax=Rosa rugosa TaxID=74645 RepID=UPI002B40605A|nr:uncharacterized protein LOC133724342 [Rosa rugosa]
MTSTDGCLKKKGQYSVKSAYWIAREQVMGNFLTSTSSGNPYQPLWKKLWKSRVPGKVQICAWRAINNILPTRQQLVHKGYLGPTNCLFCTEALETTGHVFCHCPTAKETFAASSITLQVSSLPSFVFKEWMLDQALHLSSDQFEKVLMHIWALWKNRNSKLWSNTAQSAQAIMLSSFTWHGNYLSAQKVQLQDSVVKPNKHWAPPSQNRVKINVDGAFLPSQNIGGMGGVIRREDGSFVACFAKPVNFSSSPKQVELLAIKFGIDLLQQLNLQYVLVESDCQVAIKEVYSDDFDLSEDANILEDIQQGKNVVQAVGFIFAPRTANTVAHKLAVVALESNTDKVWIDQAPVHILDALYFDCNHLP